MSVMAVDEFVPMETSNMVVRYNRRATQSKKRKGLPKSNTRAHVVCALLRGQGQKGRPTPIKKGCTDQMRVFKFIPTKTFNRLKCHTNQK